MNVCYVTLSIVCLWCAHWFYRKAVATGRSGVRWAIIALLLYGVSAFLWEVFEPESISLGLIEYANRSSNPSLMISVLGGAHGFIQSAVCLIVPAILYFWFLKPIQHEDYSSNKEFDGIGE